MPWNVGLIIGKTEIISPLQRVKELLQLQHLLAQLDIQSGHFAFHLHSPTGVLIPITFRMRGYSKDNFAHRQVCV